MESKQSFVEETTKMMDMCTYWNTLDMQCTVLHDILNNYIVIYFSCNWWSSGGFVVDHFTCDVYCLSNEKEGWRKLPTGRTEVHKLFIHEGPWQGILCMIHWHYSTSFQNTLELESFLHHLSRRLKEASLIKICPLSVVIIVVNFSHFYLLLLQNHWANLNITVSGRKAGPQYHTFYIGI